MSVLPGMRVLAAVVGAILLAPAARAADRGMAVVYTPVPAGRGGLAGPIKIYEHSMAVVIGIDKYQSPDVPPLGGAVRDAELVAAELRKQGFAVKVLRNERATGVRIREVLGDELPNQLGPEDRVLIYFAGHGVSTGEGDSALGYLMPVDGSRAKPRARGIPMTELTGWFNDYRCKHVMFVADACYSGLALSTRAMGMSPTRRDYLLQITRKPVRMIITAGGSGQEASEWRGQGLFTRFFLEAIQGSADSDHDGIVTSDEVAAYVKPNVSQTALTYLRAEQTPLVGRRGEGEFVFVVPAPADMAASALPAGGGGAGAASTAAPAPVPAPKAGSVSAAGGGGSPLPAATAGSAPTAGGSGVHGTSVAAPVAVPAPKAGSVSAADGGGSPLPAATADSAPTAGGSGVHGTSVAAPAAAAPPARTPGPAEAQLALEDESTPPPEAFPAPAGEVPQPPMVLVPAGVLVMGSTDGDPDERPPHRVRLSEFYLDRYEVTNELFAQFLNALGRDTDETGRPMVAEHPWGVHKVGGRWEAQPGYEKHPAINLTWNGAQKYAKHYGKRLPTEAEWEYACRAGSTGKWACGDVESGSEDLGWFRGSSSGRTRPVGRRKANASGLYDMHGNVWEWCSDWYHPNYYMESSVQDPQGPPTGTYRVLRGGSINFEAGGCRSAKRGNFDPAMGYYDVGFRCASSRKPR